MHGRMKLVGLEKAAQDQLDPSAPVWNGKFVVDRPIKYELVGLDKRTRGQLDPSAPV